MRIAEAFVEIRIDGKKAEKDAKETANKSLGAMRDVFSTAAVGAVFSKVIGAASSLEQAVGATATVFGTAGRKVDEFARTSASALGISERAARELTASLGALLQNFGFSADEAANLSIELGTLGADLAAAFGGSPEEAVQALGAALRGETDPVERFGISLSEARIQAKAFELGLYSGKGAIDANAKAQAALALISEQTAKVAGQSAREADTAAGQQARAAAQLEDAMAKAGEALLPIYARAAELVGTLATRFAELPGPVQSGVLALAGLVALSGPIGTVKGLVTDMVGGFKNAGAAAKVAAGFVGGFAAALTALQVIDAFRGDFANLTDEMNAFLTTIGPEAKTVTVDTANAFGDLTQAAFDAGTSFDKVGDGFDVLLTGADMAEKWGEAMSGAFDKVLAQSPEAAQAVVDSLYLVEYAAERGSVEAQRWMDEYNLSGDVITGFQTKIDNAVGATETLTGVTADGAEATGDMADATADARDRFREAADAALEQRDAIADLYEEMLRQVDAQLAYERSADDAERAVADFNATMGDSESTLEDIDDAARDAADQLIDTARAFAESKGAALDSKTGVDLMIESLYSQALALAPDSPLRARLLEYIGELQKIPTEVDTQIGLRVSGQTITRDGDRIGIRALPGQVVASARGRYVPARANLLSTFGEQGPEAILPLDKPNRLVELLGDPRIGGPIGDALGAAQAPATSMGFDFGGRSPVTIVVEGNIYGDQALQAALDDWGNEQADRITRGRSR